jgi:hypothetical protein
MGVKTAFRLSRYPGHPISGFTIPRIQWENSFSGQVVTGADGVSVVSVP